MPGRKRRHECGHLGRGKFCHRCAQAAMLEKVLLEQPNRDGVELMKVEITRLRSVSRAGTLVQPTAPAPEMLQ